MKATHHAKQRFSERTDVAEKNYDLMAQDAYKYGRKLRAFCGELYDYLLTKSITSKRYTLRVYADIIFVFDAINKRLLTVYPVPEEYLPIDNFLVHTGSPCIICVKKVVDGVADCLYVCEGDTMDEDIARAIEFKTKQSATNYIRNNNTINLYEQNGYEVIIF